MTNDADRAVLSRPLKVDEIRDGTSGETAATKPEMEAHRPLARSCGARRGSTFPIASSAGGSGRLHLTGRLHADVTQTCVVSLDPVEASLDVPVEVEFWPAALVEELERNAEEPGNPGASRLA